MNLVVFKDALVRELEFMKHGIYNIKTLKELLDETPDEFVLEKDVLLKMIEVMRTFSPDADFKRKEEIVQIFKAIFDRVDDYGEAVVTYFDSCSDNDHGPFGVNNFPIGQYITDIEAYYGNHNEISIEQCLEPSKLFAWALIGNTKECLMHFCNQTIVMQNTLLNFLRFTFENIPAVCKYKANFKSVKGSFILTTVCEIIQRYSQFSQNLDTIQHMLLRMSIPRKQKQLSLIPAEILYEEILQHLIMKDMTEFWLRLFAEFVRGLKKNSIKIGWNCGREDMLNPVYLSVFLIKLLKSHQFHDFDSDETFKNLGDLFKAQSVEFDNLCVFKSCEEIDWASKFAILDFLSIPSTSYQREIPAALYHVLSDDAKSNYVKLEDANPSFEHYLIGLFELSLTAEQIPDEFITGALIYVQTYDVSNCIAICLYRAYSNLLPYREIEIKENTIGHIERLLKIFDCKMDLGGCVCTPALFEVISKLQPCLVIGRAALAGILNHKSLYPSKNLLCDYQKLDKATHRLLSTFLAVSNLFYSPFHDELRAVLDNKGPPITTSKLSIMSAVYILLKKLADSLCKSLENPPEQLKLLTNRLKNFLHCYIEYVEKEYS